MDQFEYCNYIEARFIAHWKRGQSGTVPDAVERSGSVFRNAFGSAIDWVPISQRKNARAIPIGVALLGGINAATLLAPNNRPVVIFDWSLPHALLDYCRAQSPDSFVGSSDWRSDSAYAKATPMERIEWFYDNLALNWHLSGWWIDQQWRIGDFDRDRNNYFSVMFALQVWFVVAHEIGHALLGHLYGAAWRHTRSPLLGASVMHFTSSHECEFEADAFALNLLLNATLPPPLDELPKAAIAEAVDILFSLFVFLEGAGDVIAGCAPWARVSHTHPAAATRSARLREPHGVDTRNMANIRGNMVNMTLHFADRWPEARVAMSRSEGIANVCLL